MNEHNIVAKFIRRTKNRDTHDTTRDNNLKMLILNSFTPNNGFILGQAEQTPTDKQDDTPSITVRHPIFITLGGENEVSANVLLKALQNFISKPMSFKHTNNRIGITQHF